MGDFESLLAENLRAVKLYISYKVSSREDADDILQETCITAFKAFNELKEESSFKPWLMQIACSRIADYYRKKARAEEIPFDEQLVVCRPASRWQQFSVRETLSRLNRREREVLEMAYWQGYSQKEMAEMLKIPEGTVKSRMHSARQHFQQLYPGKDEIMKKLPDKMFDYQIVKTDKIPFETVWEELNGWFLVPREGNVLQYGLYDFPERTCTERFYLSCNGQAEVHGIRGVKIEAVEKEGKETMIRHFVAQLTKDHCRYLSESHEEDGVEILHTFMDGASFTDNWGFGPDNIGNETHLKMKGLIKREGSVVTSPPEEVMDVVGRYDVTINGRVYDTICLMDIGLYDENTVSEQYIDKNGRTVLWRRFNKKNHRWNFDHHETVDEDKIRDNEVMEVNGQMCYHWYDCITDYIL